MLFQPASNSCGLNLQEGGNTLIWFSLYANLEEYMQTIKRIHRQGQKNTAVIYHLITKDTVDEKTIKILQQKDNNQQKLLNAVMLIADEIIKENESNKKQK